MDDGSSIINNGDPLPNLIFCYEFNIYVILCTSHYRNI